MGAPLRELFSRHSFIRFVKCPSYAKHAARCVNKTDKRVNKIDTQKITQLFRNCGQ